MQDQLQRLHMIGSERKIRQALSKELAQVHQPLSALHQGPSARAVAVVAHCSQRPRVGLVQKILCTR